MRSDSSSRRAQPWGRGPVTPGGPWTLGPGGGWRQSQRGRPRRPTSPAAPAPATADPRPLPARPRPAAGEPRPSATPARDRRRRAALGAPRVGRTTQWSCTSVQPGAARSAGGVESSPERRGEERAEAARARGSPPPPPPGVQGPSSSLRCRGPVLKLPEGLAAPRPGPIADTGGTGPSPRPSRNALPRRTTLSSRCRGRGAGRGERAARLASIGSVSPRPGASAPHPRTASKSRVLRTRGEPSPRRHPSETRGVEGEGVATGSRTRLRRAPTAPPAARSTLGTSRPKPRALGSSPPRHLKGPLAADSLWVSKPPRLAPRVSAAGLGRGPSGSPCVGLEAPTLDSRPRNARSTPTA